MFLGKFLTLFIILISHKQISASCPSCDSSKSLLFDRILPPGSYSPIVLEMSPDCKSEEIESSDISSVSKQVDLDDLLEMIDSDSLPDEIVYAKQDILRFMLESKLEFSEILRPLLRYSHLNPLDFIVSGLSRVRETLYRFCHVQKAIDKLISYLLARKHLSSSSIEADSCGNCPSYAPYLRNYPPIIQNYFFINDQNTEMSKKIDIVMNYLLARLAPPEEIKNNANDGDEVEDIPDITTPIPTVAVPETTEIITTLPPPPPPPSPFIHLIQLLPKPSNDIELKYYNLITAFLSQPDLPKLLGSDFNIDSYKNDTDLLVALLAKAIVLRLDAEMVAAIKYYLEYEVALARIQLKTQKKIEKQFDLSGIFLDVFNLSVLSDDQRGAFDAFFHYILELDSSKIDNFDTWTDAKSRGEFMQLLFNYFKNQNFVPENIKMAIDILYPIIKMDGSGASPP